MQYLNTATKEVQSQIQQIPLIHNHGTGQMLDCQTVLTLTSNFTGNFFVTALRDIALPIIFVSP